MREECQPTSKNSKLDSGCRGAVAGKFTSQIIGILRPCTGADLPAICGEDDIATVPLFYENRIPELQLSNQNLNPELESMLERAELDNEEEEKLACEVPHEYDFITRDNVLSRGV